MNGISQLKNARKEGDKCLAARFHIGDNCIIYIDDIDIRRKENAFINIRPFRDAVAAGLDMTGEARRLIVRLSIVRDADIIRNTAAEAATAGVLAYCDSFGSMSDLFDPPVLDLREMYSAATVEDVSQALVSIVKRISAVINAKISGNTGKVIKAAKVCINELYASDIILADVADSVHMS